MKKNLKELLNANHDRSTKAELISLISGVHNVIGEGEFKNIINLKPSELDSLEKKELIDIVDSLSNAYEENWDTKLANASATVQSTFKSFIDFSEEMQRLQDQQFSVQNASNADFAAELGSIDFANLIGGPLDACVTAQSNASMSTVSFIQDVAFDDQNELRMVDFSHSKEVTNPNLGKDPAEVPPGTDVSSPTITENITLNVPFVSLLNVPSLRIENCTIDFNVKLNSVYTKDISSEFELDTSLGLNFKKVKFDVSASYRRAVSTGVRVEKEYTMGVKVLATNDQLPGGLENVLGILAG